jgi:hypothetical protein
MRRAVLSAADDCFTLRDIHISGRNAQHTTPTSSLEIPLLPSQREPTMGSEHLPLRHSGIYHNLPTFSPEIKDLTAIVTGANGISGFHTCRALLDSPSRWKKIYALSRRPPPEGMMQLLSPEQRAKIEHVACDFLKGPEELAETMRGAGVEAVDCKLETPLCWLL